MRASGAASRTASGSACGGAKVVFMQGIAFLRYIRTCFYVWSGLIVPPSLVRCRVTLIDLVLDEHRSSASRGLGRCLGQQVPHRVLGRFGMTSFEEHASEPRYARPDGRGGRPPQKLKHSGYSCCRTSSI